MFLFQLFQVLSWSFQRNLIFNFDEVLRRPGNNDQGPRAEAACVVCARKFWKHDLKQLVLFSDPDDEDLITPNDTVAKGSQARMCDLLGVDRYGERWKRRMPAKQNCIRLLSLIHFCQKKSCCSTKLPGLATPPLLRQFVLPASRH